MAERRCPNNESQRDLKLGLAAMCKGPLGKNPENFCHGVAYAWELRSKVNIGRNSNLTLGVKRSQKARVPYPDFQNEPSGEIRNKTGSSAERT